jgi:DNA repair protein RecO (recombination protein O)
MLTALTKNEGKIRILAKGARRIKSKLACHVEPFSDGKFFLVEGKRYWILAGAEASCPFESISNDFERYKDATYIAEILEMTTQEGVESKKIFEVARQSLAEIKQLDRLKRQIVERYLEFQILKVSGWEPNYQNCLKCNEKLTEQKIYSGSFEGMVCEKCNSVQGEVSINTLKVLRLMGQTSLSAFLKIKGIEEYSEPLRKVISPFLYDILPSTPKSIKL